MYKFMKVTSKDSPYERSQITFEIDSDMTATAVVEEFANFLLACTFHPDSIKRALIEASNTVNGSSKEDDCPAS